MCVLFLFLEKLKKNISLAIFLLRQHEDIRLFPVFGCGVGWERVIPLLATPSKLKQMNLETLLERFELFLWRFPGNGKDGLAMGFEGRPGSSTQL